MEAEADVLREQRETARTCMCISASGRRISKMEPVEGARVGGPLYERFVSALRRATSGDRSVIRLMFHGTPAPNVEPICTDGFDPSKRRSVPRGEWLTASLEYAIRKTGTVAGPTTVLVVACIIDATTVAMPECLLRAAHEDVVVIVDHHAALPLFKVTYSS